MAAMKPRTGDGPLEATAEGRSIVVRIPTEGGGRLVIERRPQDAPALAEVLPSAIYGEIRGVGQACPVPPLSCRRLVPAMCLPVLRPVCDHRGACGVRPPRGLLFGAWTAVSAREPADRSVGGDGNVWNRGFACACRCG